MTLDGDQNLASPNTPPWLTVALSALTERLAATSSSSICVGFSGGSDSLALLRVAQMWAHLVGRPIVALTVDHGLNPQSEAWTAAAAAAAARLGVGWRGLVWSGDKPTRGLPAAARAARHALLAAAAVELGACVVLLGHTADDVTESALIREDTPGHGRLRPWSPSPVWPQGHGVFLLRPLLAARRAELRAWLSRDGLSWLEDPANDDPRFARSRARAQLAGRQVVREGFAFPSETPDVQRLAKQVEATADGRLALSREALAGAPREAVRRVASAALVCTGGGTRPPRRGSLDRLLDAIASGKALACTLAGARIASSGRDDAIVFARDAGERARGGLTPLSLSTGEGGVFDGRFEVRAGCEPVQIVALAGRINRLDPSDRKRLGSIPAGARGALPAAVDTAGAVRLPAPFGEGPAEVRTLVGERFTAACGLVGLEAQLASLRGMAL